LIQTLNIVFVAGVSPLLTERKRIEL
jgi:hypothetical protein